MSEQWWLVVGVGREAIVLKASGPLILGGRTVSSRLADAIHLLPDTILSSLVVSQTLVTGRSISLDARLIGIASASLLAWRRAPIVAVVFVSAAITATIRGLGLDS